MTRWMVMLVSVADDEDRKSTRLNSSHQIISYAVFCLKKKKRERISSTDRDKQKVISPTKGIRPGDGIGKPKPANQDGAWRSNNDKYDQQRAHSDHDV